MPPTLDRMKTVYLARIVLAFIAAALWLPALVYLRAQTPAEMFGARFPLLLTVPLTIFVAVPAFLAMRARVSLVLCAAMGMAIGALGALLFLLTTHWEAAVNWAPAFFGCGLVSSLLFWVIGVWRNREPSSAV